MEFEFSPTSLLFFLWFICSILFHVIPFYCLSEVGLVVNLCVLWKCPPQKNETGNAISFRGFSAFENLSSFFLSVFVECHKLAAVLFMFLLRLLLLLLMLLCVATYGFLLTQMLFRALPSGHLIAFLTNLLKIYNSTSADGWSTWRHQTENGFHCNYSFCGRSRSCRNRKPI